jgi:hypothetical protein
MGNSTLSQVSTARLTANGTLSKSTKSANSIYQSIGKTASSDIDGLLKSAFDQLRSTGFDGVTGLEIGYVDEMKNAITDYVTDIEEAIAPLNSGEAEKAFGKRIAPAVEAFVGEVKNSCLALISNMKAFREDLDAVKAAMEAKASSVSGAVGSTSSDLSSSVSKWTYSGESK